MQCPLPPGRSTRLLPHDLLRFVTYSWERPSWPLASPSSLRAAASLSLAFFTFRVCLLISAGVTRSLQPGRGRHSPTPGIISAQPNGVAAVGSGLVPTDFVPARPRGCPGPPGVVTFKIFAKSKVLQSSPSLLQAWSPCSLLQAQICSGFSRLSFWGLRFTLLPGWDVTLVTGLSKMQLVNLVGSADL